MVRDSWGISSPDQAAVVELVDRLAGEWSPRGQDVEKSVQEARRALADSGLWALGLPDSAGGGGADFTTTQLAIARVALHWPALGLAMAHLQAAGTVLGRGPRRAVLAAAAREARPVAVVEAPADGEGPASVERVDVGAASCDLVVLRGSGCLFLPEDRVVFGSPSRRTGLDGSLGVPATVPVGTGEALGADADAARAALCAGMLAVAAGLAHAASAQAHRYAGIREQFGAPLSALPTMRDQLAVLHGDSVMLLATALREPGSVIDAAVAARRGVEWAVEVAGAALQCFGGYGYLEEYPAAGLFRDAVSLRAAAAGIRGMAAGHRLP